MSFADFYLVRRRFILRALAGSLAAWVITSFLASILFSHYRIGLDLNDIRCLPWRVYLIHIGHPPLVKGEYVAFNAAHGMMGARFDGKLIGKQIAAVEGDHVVIKHDVLYINDKRIDGLPLMARLKAVSGQYDRDQIVPHGKFFALGTEPRSYDSRYWGWVDVKSVVGSVRPII